MSGPNLEDVTKAFCEFNLPYKCLKYGTCYDVTSYCDSENYSVESCFPEKYSRNTTALFKWCLDVAVNKSQLIHTSCTHACYAKFGCNYVHFKPKRLDKLLRMSQAQYVHKQDR
uniref:Uncharacterized protein n=1 Tax=Arion vulgaris TaxID=1028688 RepID=A0A0B7B189_9EUPU